MLKLDLRWRGSCPRHKRYNPETEGEGGIKGGFTTCTLLFSCYRSFAATAALNHKFDDEARARGQPLRK
jgi:hypothetical protein